MSHLSTSSSRRKRLSSGQPGLSSQRDIGGTVRAVVLVVLGLFTVVWLIAPDQIDRAMSRAASMAGETGSEANDIWKSVVSVIASEDGDTGPTARSGPVLSGAASPQAGTVASGNTGQRLVTHGHDIIEMRPQATISLEESTPDNPATIVRLIDGTIFVEAAKKKNGQTLSVETRYLVATVKGTKFDVTVTEHGAAVAVDEGLVAVRAAGSSDSVDVRPGNTAIVSALAAATLIVRPTPSGGAAAAIEAARPQPASKMPSSVTYTDRI